MPTLSIRLNSVLRFRIDDRRCLRLLEEADAEELYALVAANREFLARWMPWAAGQTLEGTLEFIRSSRQQLADNQGFQTAIIDDGRIVGVLGFHGLDRENLSTRIGYWIAASSQGHVETNALVSSDHDCAGGDTIACRPKRAPRPGANPALPPHRSVRSAPQFIEDLRERG